MCQNEKITVEIWEKNSVLNKKQHHHNDIE